MGGNPDTLTLSGTCLPPPTPHHHRCMPVNWHRKKTSPSSLRVPDQNGVSQLYNMLEVYHSGLEPSSCTFGGWNSSLVQVGSVLGSLSCRRGGGGGGGGSLGVNMSSDSIPPKLFWMRV